MKKITTLLLLFASFTTFAAEGIVFEKDMTWADVKAKAKKENKMIFFDAYTTWCGPCKYLESSVYTDNTVASYYNKNFINVKFDMEAGEGVKLAAEFDVTAYPTLLFFTPEGKLIHKNVGALKAPEFVDLGKDAGNPDKQYFTLQQKVIDKGASDNDFLAWTKMADEMQDQNRGSIASGWLAEQKDILATAELAKAIMLSAVTEEQLAYLYKERKKLQQLLQWDAAKTNTELYLKLFNLALKTYDSESPSTTGFANVIKKFEPTRVSYAVKDLQLFVALSRDDDQAKAIDILTGSLQGKARLSLKEFGALFFDYLPKLDEDAIAQLKTKLAAYTITVTDKGQEAWLYLVQSICHSRLGENEKATLFAEKANKQGGLPPEYQGFLKTSFRGSR